MQDLVPPFMEDLADVPFSQEILTNRPLTVRFPWEFLTNRTNRQKKFNYFQIIIFSYGLYGL